MIIFYLQIPFLNEVLLLLNEKSAIVLTMNKCGVIALRNILLIILCVASISFLRNYQIVKTTVYIASENVVKENLSSGYNVGAVWPPALGIWNLSSGSSHGLSSVHGSLKSLHDGQIDGGSLNMLDTNIQKMEHPHTSLLSKLLKVISRSIKHIHSVAMGEFPKWQTLFHLQKNKYIYNLDNLKTTNAN